MDRVALGQLMGIADVLMAVSYVLDHQWLLAIVWVCYGVAAVALSLVNQR